MSSFNNSHYSKSKIQPIIKINARNENPFISRLDNRVIVDSVTINKKIHSKSLIDPKEQLFTNSNNELIALASANSTIFDMDMAKVKSSKIRDIIVQNSESAIIAQGNLEYGQVLNALG